MDILLLSIFALRLLSLLLLDRLGLFEDFIIRVGISEMVILPFNPPLSAEKLADEMVPDAEKDEAMTGEGVDVRLDVAAVGSIGDDDGDTPPGVFRDDADVALMDAFKISASIDTFSIQYLVNKSH